MRLLTLLLAFSAVLNSSPNRLLYCQDWQNNQKSTHFVVYYNNADEKFITGVIDRSEEYYVSIYDKLGFRKEEFWLRDDRVKIYIYDGIDDYREHTGKPSWSGGMVDYRGKVIESYPWSLGFFESLLPHELGHIIFREYIGALSNSPAWLDEGVAVYQESLNRDLIMRALKNASGEGRLIPLEELSAINIAFVKDRAKVELYYIESYSVVDYLILEFGKYKFKEFCLGVKERKPFDEAIKDTYIRFNNLQDLNDAWVRYIEES